MCKHRLRILLCISVLFQLSQSNAQTDNYWSWTFNTSSMLVAGAVVGGSAGPSAIFYNPSLISRENVLSLTLTGSLTSLQFFEGENIAGDNIDASETELKIQPRFLSYIIPNKNSKLGIETAILSPVSEEYSFLIQYNDELDILKRIQGEETYSGYLSYNRKYNDTWIGGGISYQLAKNFFIGSSFFVSIKSMTYKFVTEAMAYQSGDSIVVDGNLEANYFAQNSISEELKYWHVGLITKLGIQYTSNNKLWGIGCNFTFPNIPIIGEGDARKSITHSNVYDDENGEFTRNYSSVDFRENGRVIVKDPFSFALGIQYLTANEKNAILISVQYFNEIATYSLFKENETTESVYPVVLIDDSEPLSFYIGANDVTNLAFGFKHFFSEKFTLMGGLRTDYSALPNDNFNYLGDQFTIRRFQLNKFHFTAAPEFIIKNFTLVAGIQYSNSSAKEIEQIINYSDPIEYVAQNQQSLEGTRKNNANISVHEFTLLVGLNVTF